MQPNSTKKMKAAHRGIITEILKHTKCKAGILKKEKARKKKEKKEKLERKKKVPILPQPKNQCMEEITVE